MPSLAVTDFDLAATVKSGHLFHYDDFGGGVFRIENGERTFIVSQESGRSGQVRFAGIDEEGVKAFFDLDLDVDGLHARLGKEKALRPFLEKYGGIRLVRQDARQAITAFILSANNNQKRIKKMVDAHRRAADRTAAEYGRLGFGYRAPFLAETERLLTPAFLQRLREAGHDEARELLIALPGVGPKVADCVLAYSELASGEAFPADVWVKRALTTWYPSAFKGKAFTDKNIQAWARKRFGTDAAYAQHYLFLAAQELLR